MSIGFATAWSRRAPSYLRQLRNVDGRDRRALATSFGPHGYRVPTRTRPYWLLWASARFGQTIRLGVRLYDRLNGGQIPKLLFAKDVPAGQIHDERGLFELLEREVGVVPR